MMRTTDQQQLGYPSTPCGAVLVCGGGVAGIQAALDLSAAGFRVYLVEHTAAVGGGMARLDKTFPTGDCATCILSPKLVECMRDRNIDVFTMADVTDLEGEPGRFTATVRQRPRYVDLAKCTACGDCAEVCPVEISSSFEAGLGTRKAIDRVYAQAAPNAFVINKKGRATCSAGCPIDSSVQAYVSLIAAGKYEEAAAVIRRENPLPSICGRVCFHPCESECNRGKLDAPINIRALKRFVMDLCPAGKPPECAPPTGKSVAVIGSGPAGLAAAHSLALAGHGVTIFEALPRAGGMLAVGIPDYRLPPEILERDLDAIRALGVTIETGAAIGGTVAPERLEHEFDAVFLAPGAHTGRKLDIPGEDTGGVLDGVAFLRAVALGRASDGLGRVAVIGGGNTAVDTARTALRLGAASVTIVYRRSREAMPAEDEEVAAALAEGIAIQYHAAPVCVVAEAGRVTGVECIRMEPGAPDASGRPRPVPVKGSEFTVPCDTLMPAVSQSPDRALARLFGLDSTDWGAIAAEPLTLETSRQGYFAGGDVVAGPSSVIEAIAHGQRAAKAIENYLAGRPAAHGTAMPAAPVNPVTDSELQALKRATPRAPRLQPAAAPASDRISDFREVEQCYTVDQARSEAQRCLNCAGCAECMQCVEACEAGAILHDQTEKMFALEVGAVLLTPGFEAFDATRRGEFGFGYAANVLTNVQFERMLSASGPTGGRISRPSDQIVPKRLAFIQCVGSRDRECGNDYCSSVCCMAATKEAILIKEHDPDIEVTIFFLDLRAYGKDFDRYVERAQKDLGVRYIRSFVSRTYEMPGTKNLRVVYTDASMKPVEEEFDMVVLSIGLEPSTTLREQANRLGIGLNQWGFVETTELAPLDTSRPGVFVGGAFQGPKDIPDTVTQASAAAARAMALLAPARGDLVRTKTYPPERDITEEPPRTGIFVCHCGSNIASVVDVGQVVDYARGLAHVAYAEESLYACADDNQARIKDAIVRHSLNRVVIASCTPRTHEPIFRDTLRDAGLNPYLLEMANIRDQCSWVHADDPDRATKKAMDLIRMAAARAARLTPLKEETAPVTSVALVVGSGIAGMTAALALAQQGFPVHLVEKNSELGGTARRVFRTLDGGDVQAFLADVIGRVFEHPRITVYLNASVVKVDGHIGSFTSSLVTSAGIEGRLKGQLPLWGIDGRPPLELKHGVTVVATGADEARPTSYAYANQPNIMTQLELSERLGTGKFTLPENGTVAMVQCVDQRNAERPYCSRVCCATAVKNALILREHYPNARIVILYRDMRTYGFREAAYREARENGVLFVRYEEDRPPELSLDERMQLRVREPSLVRDLELDVDALVLAAPMVPGADGEELARLLRVPLNSDGFFLEAHAKLRPVDFASEGLFLCGTAHAPKFIAETIAQANAVAARAAAVLARKHISVAGQTAWVDQDRCVSCMTCVHVCPYAAPRINEDNKAEIAGAVCMGCGSCAAECPACAITLRHYGDLQVRAAVAGLLGGMPQLPPAETAWPEPPGVAPSRWHEEAAHRG